MGIKFKKDFAEMKENDVVNFTQGASEVLNHDGISEQKTCKVEIAATGCDTTTNPVDVSAIFENTKVEIEIEPIVEPAEGQEIDITISGITYRGFPLNYNLEESDDPDILLMSFAMPADDVVIVIVAEIVGEATDTGGETTGTGGE